MSTGIKNISTQFKKMNEMVMDAETEINGEFNIEITLINHIGNEVTKMKLAKPYDFVELVPYFILKHHYLIIISLSHHDEIQPFALYTPYYIANHETKFSSLFKKNLDDLVKRIQRKRGKNNERE